jgi:1,4-dihydroxy-2-naphthoyl-CoA synthase
MSDPILFEIDDGIALITLNRPDKLNALNYDLIDRLMTVLDTNETDAAVRAVILTGAGERAFSAGADHEFAGSVQCGAIRRDFVRRGQAMTARLEAFRKPVIAAVSAVARMRDHRPCIWPSPASVRNLQNNQSVCRRPSAERSGCHGSPGWRTLRHC